MTTVPLIRYLTHSGSSLPIPAKSCVYVSSSLCKQGSGIPPSPAAGPSPMSIPSRATATAWNALPPESFYALCPSFLVHPRKSAFHARRSVNICTQKVRLTHRFLFSGTSPADGATMAGGPLSIANLWGSFAEQTKGACRMSRMIRKRWKSKFARFVRSYGVEPLAAGLDVRPSAIYHWIRGATAPRPAHAAVIQRLARECGSRLTMDEIYGHSRTVRANEIKPGIGIPPRRAADPTV